ncbi:hypothetical protein [Escherichia coli]|uniref:hypothetical protein n=1 Tax=Escherichia coli TaxID=562 RepID=UPI002DBDF4CF|nr:hypothetical protein [Escherichia coli]MEC3742578.1 hypothetical protein [Escherichia coli]
MPENPASYRVVRKKSYLFNKAKNVATVALNNKNARVLWVLLTNDKEISPEEVMGAAYM